MSDQKAKEMVQARDALLVIVSTLRLLVRQGLAVRGHEDIDSNFMQTLQVLRRVIADIQEARLFKVIMDETADVTQHEQMSVCIRLQDGDTAANASTFSGGAREYFRRLHVEVLESCIACLNNRFSSEAFNRFELFECAVLGKINCETGAPVWDSKELDMGRLEAAGYVWRCVQSVQCQYTLNEEPKSGSVKPPSHCASSLSSHTAFSGSSRPPKSPARPAAPAPSPTGSGSLADIRRRLERIRRNR
ncbi:unnamed protein product [Arctogadus glacialis]